MISRRRFLQSAAAAAPLILTAPAFARSRPGPNDQVAIGLIGLGGRCTDIMKTCVEIPQARIVSVCDCFKPRVDYWMEHAGKERGWKPYLDFREMIEKEKLDGVMVETTTHARAWVACHAMAAGLDAYIEKPMSLTIAEGREMVKCARKYKRVTQVGTQQRSIPLNNWASDLVKKGALGKVHTVLAPNFAGPLRWAPKPAEPMPEGTTEGWWDVWTNQAEFRPYHSELHKSWSTWWDYDGGGVSFGVTGWGAHSYDQVQRGLGTDTTGPVEVVLEEPVKDVRVGAFEKREISEDETGAAYYQMVENTHGPRAKVTMKFASGTELKLHLDADRCPGLGCVFIGDKGRIEINRDKISADPKELIQGADRPAPLSVPETRPHIENWIACIKSRKRCNADIEYGQRASTLCYLVNIARDVGRVGEPLKWDPKKERFTNCDEANAMLSRPRRAGYELPKKGRG
jgi:hypothetical protein